MPRKTYMTLNEILKRLRTAKDNILLIHYSCQSLGDGDQKLSARISSIAVTHFTTSVTNSFSVHLIAEKKRIPKEDIFSNYDTLEAEMLSQFFSFVRERLQYFWVHWNMSHTIYGFEALEHRYTVLTGLEAPTIDEEKKFNLIELVCTKYGKDSIDDPKMKVLMSLNGGLHRNFLDGQQEAESLGRLEFIRVHQSTITKTYFFSDILNRLISGIRIKTSHNNLRQKAEIMLEHPAAKIIGLVASIFSLYKIIKPLFWK
jgi:hypothetical protein